MSKLAAKRTNNKTIIDLANRIDLSQVDEINFMESWLSSRDQNAHEMNHKDHMHMNMSGMATPAQIESLKNSNSTDFDRLFLQLMIKHHDGALDMVDELKKYPGSANDQLLNEFVSDLINDQAVEIERMNLIAVNLSDDPRSGLAPGLFTANEAILNLEKIVSLRKPVGFYDPNDPGEKGKKDTSVEIDDDENVTTLELSKSFKSPILNFANTDMAFSKDLLVTGSYHGFNIYNILEDGIPELVSSIVCPGGQGDVSIVGNILIMSVEETRSRIDCGLNGVGSDSSLDRFRGIRIFDISNPQNPIQVGAVQTCRGSHTHSVVSGPTQDNKIIVYNSGTAQIRDREELDQCIGEVPGDNRTALFRIDIIEIPISNPSESRIVSSPTVFADPESGALGGLWAGGDHGDNSQETNRTDQCHDITVFPSANIAAGACSGNGILFDISDPYNPTRLDVVTDIGFAYWHSATFNNDGTKVIFTDEWGGGGRARCRAWDPIDWGADAIYDIVDNKLEFRSHYKMPAPQLETENCVAHNGSIIPIPNRDIFVQAWYQGGISIVDFTDSTKPVEIAYFDRGPIDDDILMLGGYWSAYYYNGYIYGTEITRGLDVFKLTPSQYISELEIDQASEAFPLFGPGVFNPQQQIPMTWPLKKASN
jgi:ferritin